MATVGRKLSEVEQNLEESIGWREPKQQRKLSPQPSAKDVGRRQLRNYGRIKIDQVMADPNQPRTEFAPDAIERLAESVRTKGQLAPIRVRWSDDYRKWIIVCGERRFRAVQAAKLETIDCCFDDASLSEAEILEQQMIENLLREDLSPIEQARGFSALMELHGWNGKQVADSLHVQASTVSRALALLDLPADIQEDVDMGAIAARSAYEISKAENVPKQRELAAKAKKGMPLKAVQAAARKRPVKKRIAPKPKRLEFFTEDGWKIVAMAPNNKKHHNYHHLKEAMDEVIEEIDARIKGNVRTI